MNVSLVIAAYNESQIIEDTVSSVLDALGGELCGFELVIVDDGSTDNTAELVASLVGDRVTLISYAQNRGKGYAVRTGMLRARGEVVFFTDADLAYGTESVLHGVREFMRTDADIVVGSRKLKKGGYGEYPGLRLIASKCFSLIARLVSGMRYDTQCGIKGFKRSAALDIFSAVVTDGFAFDFEVMMLAERGGYKVVQMPVTIVNHRDSRVSVLRDSFKMFREILSIRRRIGKR